MRDYRVVPREVESALCRWLEDSSDSLSKPARIGRIITFAAAKIIGHREQKALDGYPFSGVLRDALLTVDREVMRRAAQLASAKTTPEQRRARGLKGGAATAARHSKRLTHDGETHTMKEWSARLGISSAGLHHRLKAGWPPERALTTRP